MASDLVHDVMDAVAKTLKKELKNKANEYNTCGVVNVALYNEAFIYPNRNEFFHLELMEVLVQTVDELKKIITKAKKVPECDWPAKQMHVRAYERLLRKLNSSIESLGD
jgi:hypothetical protein